MFVHSEPVNRGIVRDMGWLAYLTPALLLFAETGFLFGLFVPGGDSMLLGLGVIASHGKLSLEWLLPLLFVGSWLGHLLGYVWGRRLGPNLAGRVPKTYLERTQSFLAKNGALAIIVAPQIPYIRTLMPFVAGATGYPWRNYLPLCAIGSLIWVVGISLVGFFLGELLPTWAIYVVVFGLMTLALLPSVLKWYREYRSPVRLSLKPLNQNVQTSPDQHEQ